MTNALLFLLLLTNVVPIPWRRWFDAFDRWASQRWPATPMGRDETGQLVEWRPRPEWDTQVTTEFWPLVRHSFPMVEEAT